MEKIWEGERMIVIEWRKVGVEREGERVGGGVESIRPNFRPYRDPFVPIFKPDPDFFIAWPVVSEWRKSA